MADEKKCRLVFCEDPKTGKLTVKPDGPCPAGYIERIHERVEREGFAFIKPKSVIEEEK